MSSDSFLVRHCEEPFDCAQDRRNDEAIYPFCHSRESGNSEVLLPLPLGEVSGDTRIAVRGRVSARGRTETSYEKLALL